MPRSQTPSAVPIEKSVLASCLVMPECADEVCESLDNTAFYKTGHKIYFDAIKHLVDSGAPVDVAGVNQYIQDKNKTEFTSATELASLLDEPVSVNLQNHIRKLKEKRALRQAIEFCNAGMKRAMDSSRDPDETLDYLRVKFGELEIDADALGNVKSTEEMSLEASERYDKAASGEVETGVKTGFKYLDSMLSGLKPSDAIFVAGRPSMGKTALAMNFAERCNEPVAVFSLEQSRDQLFDRLVSMKTRIDLARLGNGLIRDAEFIQINDCLGNLYEKKIFIDDSAGLSMGQIRSRTRQMIRTHGIKLIIIDYIQLIKPDFRRDGNRNLEVGKIAQGIKNMAKEFRIPVIGISQLSRDLERRPNPHKVPKLSDLRDSGEIEQVADVVIFVYRPEVYNDLEGTHKENGKPMENQATLVLAKQRQGPIGNVILRFQADCVRFDNVDFYAER